MCFTYDARPTAFRQTERTARKSRRCSECRCWIWPGEIYLSVWGVWRGYTQTYQQCERCQALIDAIEAVELEHGCGAHESRPAFGELFEHLEYYTEGIEGRVPASILISPNPDDVIDKLCLEYSWAGGDLDPVEEHGEPVG